MKKRGAANDEFVSHTVGYCYYQLSDFAKAVIHLSSRALETASTNYYSRFFLALSLRGLDREAEAINQLITCLQLNPSHTDEILDHLLPLVSRVMDDEVRKRLFTEITSMDAVIYSSSLNVAKILFYQRRENELTPDMLEEAQFCHFYDAKRIADYGATATINR